MYLLLQQVRGNTTDNDGEIMRTLLQSYRFNHLDQGGKEQGVQGRKQGRAEGEGEEGKGEEGEEALCLFATDDVPFPLGTPSASHPSSCPPMRTSSSFSSQLLVSMATEEARKAYEWSRDRAVVVALLLVVSPSEGPLALSAQVRPTHPINISSPHTL